MFDQVIVSDAGKHLQARTTVQEAGLIATAMRASDIGMDRVWQLEKETFGNQAGFLFMSLSDLVQPYDDATVLHPEIPRRLPDIRTDLGTVSMSWRLSQTRSWCSRSLPDTRALSSKAAASGSSG